MTVKAILSRKGTNVVTADPNASLGEAVKTLAAHRIGAIVVTGADHAAQEELARGLERRLWVCIESLLCPTGDVGKSDPPWVEPLRGVEDRRITHDDLGAEAPVSQIGPIANIAIADTDEVRQAIAAHIGEENRLEIVRR